MKKSYLVQLIIDVIVIAIGICLYAFPNVGALDANQVFYTTMGIYSFLELAEYVFDHTRKEPLYIFFASLTAAFSGLFLRSYPANYVLSITIAVWMIMYAIIKMINLSEIQAKKTNLFKIKLSCMSMLVILGIIISINIYYRVNVIGFMLALLYLAYGGVELFCDFLSYLSEDSKYLKE